MAVTIGSLLIKLGLDSGEFKSGLSQAEKDLRKQQRAWQKNLEGLAETGRNLTLAITLPMAVIGQQAVAGFVAQQQAMADVNAALASMGTGAGRTAAQLSEAADALEMNSLFDAEIILKQVTAQLLTFGNIAGEQFDRAQQAAVDMAARLGGEPQAAAIALGKALNDPADGINKLTRLGVEFTDSQKQLVASLMETGRQAEAQQVILAELEKQFGGAASAAADATPWRRAQVAIGQAMDTIGAAILPIIGPIANGVARLAEAFAQLPAPAQNSILAFAALTAAAGPLISVFTLLKGAIGPLGLAVAAANAQIAASGTAAGVAATGMTALRIQAAALLSMLGPWALAAGGVAVAIYLLNTRLDEGKLAADAHRRGLTSLGEVQQQNIAITQRLASATGQLREEVLAEARAARENVRAQLARAQATLAAARAAGQAAQMEARANLARASTTVRGAGGGIDNVTTQIGQNGQALRVAEAKIAEANGRALALVGELNRLESEINRPVARVAVGSSSISAAGGSNRTVVGQIAAAVDEDSSTLSSMLDRLYPEVARLREYREDIATLARADLPNGIDRSAAMSRRLAELGGLDPGSKIGVSIDIGAEEIVPDMGRVQDALRELAGNAQDNTVRVAESFKDMATKTLDALSNLTNAIKGGGFFDILQGVVGLGLQLGGAGAFGSTIAKRINGVKGYASGTNYAPGGVALVGERGPELVDLPRGARVVPNHALGGGKVVNNFSGNLLTPEFWAMIQRGDAMAAQSGATMAGARTAFANSRRVG